MRCPICGRDHFPLCADVLREQNDTLIQQQKERQKADDRARQQDMAAREEQARRQLEAIEREAEASREAHRLAIETQTHRVESAIQELLVEQERTVSEAWKLQARSNVLRAQELDRAGLHDEALHHVLAAMELDRGSLSAHVVASSILATQGEHGRARGFLATAVKLLGTTEYNAPGWFEVVLWAIPKDDEEIRVAFLAMLDKAAAGWTDSRELRSCLQALVQFGLLDAARRLASASVGKAGSLAGAVCRDLAGDLDQLPAAKKWLADRQVRARAGLASEIASLKELVPVVPVSAVRAVKRLLEEQYALWQGAIDAELQQRATEGGSRVPTRPGHPVILAIVSAFAADFMVTAFGFVMPRAIGNYVMPLGALAFFLGIPVFYLLFKGQAKAVHARQVRQKVAADLDVFRRQEGELYEKQLQAFE